MKKLYLLMILLAFATIAQAQHISVKDFYYAENDLTARTYGTSVEDQNGNLCALIKVETTEKGTWAFDVGMLGVTKTEFQNAAHPAEIWVHVPFGVTWMTIQHEQLGKLNHYPFPSGIEKGCTYVMKLTTGKVTTVVEDEIRMQYLIFQISPSNAVLFVNDELWDVASDGSSRGFVNFGTYNYRVQAPNYHTEVGKVTVNDPENAHKVPVTLKPDFVNVTLRVDGNAEIWVNNEKKGVGSWTGPLGKGTYKIECKLANHETSMISQEITSALEGQTITLPAPTPIYGSLNIESTPNYASIFIDGKLVGETPKFVNEILVGQHEISLRMEGYKDYSEAITITKDKRNQVTATLESGPNDETFTVNGVSFTMKYVEGGTFWMGAQKSDSSGVNYYRLANDRQSPVHSVTLSCYYMGETEVTQALWKAVMGSNPSYFKGDNLPVEHVSWYACQEFIHKLNQMIGKNFRLPTEAEWEYAARGGKWCLGYEYSGGNNIEDVAWFSNNSDKETHPVKEKKANELGLYDMSGNVWEWCQDWFGDYGSSSQTNPTGPLSGYCHVFRGGCYCNWSVCSVSNRGGGYLTDNQIPYAGFRLCIPVTDDIFENNNGQSSPQETNSTIPEGALPGKFSISPSEQVYFSKGNLQYRASTDTWRFAEQQWDMVGDANKNISSSYNGWIDLFGWGTGNNPTNTSTDNSDYPSFNDWGNRMGTGWRTLTKEEWKYVFEERMTSSGMRYAKATVNGVCGVILLPDDWNKKNYYLGSTNQDVADYSSNSISASSWNTSFAPAGAVFLPAAGNRIGTSVYHVGSFGYYWSALNRDNGLAYGVYIGGGLVSYLRYDGRSVRLVAPAE